MQIENYDVKTSEPQIEIIEQLRSADLQDSNEMANNEADAVLKNTKVQRTIIISELEQVKKTEKDIKMHDGNNDIKSDELENAQLKSPDLQDSNERMDKKADVVLKNKKVQRTTELEQVKETEKNIKMYEGNHDIENYEPEDTQNEVNDQRRRPESENSHERTNSKANVVLKDVKVQKLTEKREDHFKIASPLSPSEVNTGTIPPDINTYEIMNRSCNREHSSGSLREVENFF